ncbi:MAG: beta(1,3)galactosyltransferase EpsH [Clostridia bacterium]|nr:beta(1,3)galactosyltransferase EpsH [Clostridia bacterium]
MILVTVGSQKFQFNRLLKKIDELIEEGTIKENVYAQTGVSDYKPRNYEFVDYMSQDEFSNKIEQADLIITHAGTGVIVNSLKKLKKVIAVPRLAKYGEHVDDHQIQLIDEFTELNFIEPVYEIEELGDAIKTARKKEYNTYVSNTENVIQEIIKFIDNN